MFCLPSFILFGIPFPLPGVGGLLLASFQEAPPPIPREDPALPSLETHPEAVSQLLLLMRGSRRFCPWSKHLTFSICSLFLSPRPCAWCNEQPGSLFPGSQTPQLGNLVPEVWTRLRPRAQVLTRSWAGSRDCHVTPMKFLTHAIDHIFNFPQSR